MIMAQKKWHQIMALALSFPSTIFLTAWAMKELTERGVISKLVGVVVFLAILCNTLFLMVYYAYKNKSQS
jgi:uncharacterized membrane protein